mmetsp:Transcript_61822/g.146377  ORF Transcript_61822/g.146377 Transcript_61822/m.146377 type:complete len:96 (-) Transcript_61822:3194-3481(-)
MRRNSIFTASRALAAAAVMVGSPLIAAAQHQMAQGAPATANMTDSTRPAALTREQVRAEVERAMRDGTWRCRTGNRGWCSNEPVATAKPDADKRP